MNGEKIMQVHGLTSNNEEVVIMVGILTTKSLLKKEVLTI